MKTFCWSYRFSHLLESGSIYLWEVCSHGTRFSCSFDGSSRGSLCFLPHALEWLEVWSPAPEGGAELVEHVFILGIPVTGPLADSTRELIARQIQNLH